MSDIPVEQIRSAIRLISPDHITPMGVRVLEQICEQWENAGTNADNCSNHKPEQHRDNRPPWCLVCGEP